MSSSPDVLMIGAGLAGLCCERHLREHGVSFEIHAASEGIGRRRAAEAVVLDFFALAAL